MFTIPILTMSVLLQEPTNSVFNVGNAIVAAIVAIIGYLFKRNQDDQDNKIKEQDDNIDNMRADLEKLKEKLNSVNLEVLKEINAISVKLAEFKRDNNHVK